MGRTLNDLADVCRRTGFPVVEMDGWQTNGRSGAGGDSTAGYESGAPNHVIVHHTASSAASDPMNGGGDVTYCCYGHEDAPVGNLYLSRDGTVYVMAGRAANTNGSGHDPCGLVRDDSMNAASIAVEAGNNGVGEPWPARQQDSYRRLCAELCAAYDIPAGQIHSHFEWAPGRKVDPAGQSDYAAGSAMWDMDLFRADVIIGSNLTPDQEDEVTDDDIDRIAQRVWAYVIHYAKQQPTGGEADAAEPASSVLSAAASYAGRANR